MKKSPHLNMAEALRHVGQVDVRESVRSFVNKTAGVTLQHASSLGVYTRYAGHESFCNHHLSNRNRRG